MDSDLHLEQAVLHAALVRPQGMQELARHAVPADFDHPVHRRIFAHLAGLATDGREPSVAALMAMLGNEELEPGLTARDYASKLFVGAGDALFEAPIRDLIETWRDRRLRRQMVQVGSVLQLAEVTPEASLRGMTDDAVHALNEITAAMATGRPKSYSAGEAAEEAFDAMLGEASPVITTGLSDLDRMLGGWPRGELTICAGRPAMGKSTLGVSTALRSARAGHGVVLFSLEMTRKQVGARMIADMAYVQRDPVTYEAIGNRDVDGRHIERIKTAAEALSGLPIAIEEQRGNTMLAITARAKEIAQDMQRKGQRLDIVMVDHIGLVRASNRYAGMRHREIAEITDGLAGLAKDLDCAVVGLCQLNRGVEGRENKRPGLSDLRDSGSIEEDASAVVFVYREAYYLHMLGQLEDSQREMERRANIDRCENVMELIVSKNRNGRTGIVRAFTDMGASAIRNLDFGGRR